MPKSSEYMQGLKCAEQMIQESNVKAACDYFFLEVESEDNDFSIGFYDAVMHYQKLHR